MQETCLVDTRVAFVSIIATAGAMDSRTRPARILGYSPPQSESRPAGHDAETHNNLHLSKTQPVEDLTSLETLGSPTLKRKAGSPNLVSSYSPDISSPADATCIQSSASPDPTDCEFRIGHLSDPTQLRSANIHSFAFDLNRYLYQLRQAQVSTSHARDHHSRDTTANTFDRLRGDALQPGAIDLPKIKSALSSHSHRTTTPSSKKSRNITRSVATGSILSDASTPSLSRFPLPPTSTDPSDPNSSQDRDEPRTPTIYHFRGASFEFVNPRSSLRIQNIQTPAEQDVDRAAYFSPACMETSRVQGAEFASAETRTRIGDMEKPSLRETPQRSLFDDLPSAYNSIRKNQKPSSPLPDRPISSSPHFPEEHSRLDSEHFASTENLLGNRIESQIQRPPPAVSFRQRFSQVFRIKGRDTSEFARGASSVPTEGNEVHEQDMASVKTFEAEFMNHDEDASTPPRQTNHPSDFRHKSSGHYYDDPSILESTMTRSRSTSFHPASHRQRNYESMPWNEIEREESTENLIASYGYDLDDFRRYSVISNLSRHRSMPAFQARNSTPTTNKQADSTIGEILEQYHHRDTTSFPLFDLSAQENYLRALEPKSGAHVRGHFSQGPSGFNVGLDNRSKKLEDQAEFAFRPDENIRTATARALNTTRGAAPLGPLPSDPSTRLKKQSAEMASRTFSENSSDLSAISYGDTRHLLLLSQPSIELGRGDGVFNPGTSNESHMPATLEGKFQDGAQLSPLPESIRRTAPTEEDSRRANDRSFEDAVSRGLKYLSRLSGLSNFQGSVYMVGSADSAQGGDGENSKEKKMRSDMVQKSIQGHPREPLKPVNASYLPVAAFQQSAVVPGILRLPTPDREAFGKGRETSKETDWRNSLSEEGLSVAFAEEGEGDEFDWETLPESRPTLRSHKTNEDSLAEWSSYSSLNTFRNVNVHPGDGRLQHGYKLHSPVESDGPMLIPAYEFRGGPGFPNRNALAPPTPAIYNTYKHPVPLSQIHENPFTSSPPQITGTPTTKASFFGARSNAVSSSPSSKKDENIPLFSLRRQNLSVVHEQTGDVSTPKRSYGFLNGLRRLSNSANFSKVPSQESSGWLGSEPGPEVSLEAEHGSPSELERGNHRPRSARLSSGVDPGLIHYLRQGDPRMASSPLSTANSFARVSRLGPRGNITGTPNGTGMREVGSSLIGSSSPAGIPSSPPIMQYSTPITAASTDSRPPRNSATKQASSPLSKFDELQYGFGDAPSKHRRGQSFRDALVAEGQAERQARRAVPGQKKLIEMTLSLDDPNTKLIQSNEACNQHPGLVGGPLQPLLPPPARNMSFPKLRSRYRSPSSHTSATRERKQKISWICFALCAMFPFTLILYGHGALDAVIVHWTAGDIRHFGHRQKLVAKVVGWGAALTTILTVVVLFVVIRTVPNSYPR